MADSNKLIAYYEDNAVPQFYFWNLDDLSREAVYGTKLECAERNLQILHADMNGLILQSDTQVLTLHLGQENIREEKYDFSMKKLKETAYWMGAKKDGIRDPVLNELDQQDYSSWVFTRIDTVKDFDSHRETFSMNFQGKFYQIPQEEYASEHQEFASYHKHPKSCNPQVQDQNDPFMANRNPSLFSRSRKAIDAPFQPMS